jgi:predicted nuclease of predicted toxin-antitoxin system
MKFLVDEDLPHAVVGLLIEFGHEAIHVRDAGLRGQPDRQIFAAQDRSAILLTSDVGFGNTLLFPPGTHRGIVVVRFPDHFRRDSILRLIRSFLAIADLSSVVGNLVIVEPGTYRIRRAPG